ncbi:hypothetical protein ACJX0J_032805, partial [Zea mays]
KPVKLNGPIDVTWSHDMKAHLAKFKEDWKDYGVIVMCDFWTGPTVMSIINFMIFCNGPCSSTRKPVKLNGPIDVTWSHDMKAHLAKFKEDWKDYGVIVMCDFWTGPTVMSIINFMIFCNGPCSSTSHSRSESVPTLDENDEPESPNKPSGFVLEELGGLNDEEMVLLNSRIGSSRKNVRKRKVVEEDIGDDFLSDSSQGEGGGDDEDGDPSGPSSVARPPTHVAIDQYNAPGQDEQPTPLRPRSKRQNKLSVKGMYMFEKV